MSARVRLSADALRDLAEEYGVCVRPVLHEVQDTVSGTTQLIPTPCGATRDSKCRPCAAKNRRLRMQQCREGWHLEEEPQKDPPSQPDDEDEDSEEQPSSRRSRSTRRRQDAPDLPRLPVEDRTIGATFTSRSGRTYRPSMFVTLTLPSYGRVTADGTPRSSQYDYRRAALDALHFPKLIDRFWQNLRRATGYQIQYFSVVEEQKRLAPHLHAAVRGAVPRSVLRQVAGATYHQVWWPAHEHVVYDDSRPPVWHGDLGYVDPDTADPLPTWQQALDALDADEEARPAHVVRFGKQLDIQGIVATEDDADRRVAYLTKYLTKAISETYADSEASRAQRRHMRKLHEQVRVLPCSPRCWNWLRYGVQPLDAREGMSAGRCPAKAHSIENLGLGGRSVLVSRRWTGKTLKDHKADRAAVVRQVLEAAGAEVPDSARFAADVRRDDGLPRFHWRIWDPLDSTVPVYRQVMTRAISERLRWKSQYEAAKQSMTPSGSASAHGPPADSLRPGTDRSASSSP